MALPGAEDLESLLSWNYTREIIQEEIVFTSMKSPATAGSVRSIHPIPEKQGWTLVFTIHTKGPMGFFSGDSVMEWFDGARYEIHGVFDLIVPEEIVQILR